MERTVALTEVGTLEALADSTPSPALVQSVACVLRSERRVGLTVSLPRFEAPAAVCASSKLGRCPVLRGDTKTSGVLEGSLAKGVTDLTTSSRLATAPVEVTPLSLFASVLR